VRESRPCGPLSPVATPDVAAAALLVSRWGDPVGEGLRGGVLIAAEKRSSSDVSVEAGSSDDVPKVMIRAFPALCDATM
jgi:hypothetical protein